MLGASQLRFTCIATPVPLRPTTVEVPVEELLLMVREPEAAPAVVQFVFFPLVFISGTYFQISSRFLNDLAGVFPVRPFNQALLNPFALDRGFAGRQLLVLAIWGVVGGFVAIRRFRWDPRPE